LQNIPSAALQRRSVFICCFVCSLGCVRARPLLFISSVRCTHVHMICAVVCVCVVLLVVSSSFFWVVVVVFPRRSRCPRCKLSSPFFLLSFVAPSSPRSASCVCVGPLLLVSLLVSIAPPTSLARLCPPRGVVLSYFLNFLLFVVMCSFSLVRHWLCCVGVRVCGGGCLCYRHGTSPRVGVGTRAGSHPGVCSRVIMCSLLFFIPDSSLGPSLSLPKLLSVLRTSLSCRVCVLTTCRQQPVNPAMLDCAVSLAHVIRLSPSSSSLSLFCLPPCLLSHTVKS